MSSISDLRLPPHEEQALLSRLLQVISGEDAVREVRLHAECAYDRYLNPRIWTDAERAAAAVNAMASALAARQGCVALVENAVADLADLAANEASVRRFDADHPALGGTYESRLAAAHAHHNRRVAERQTIDGILDALRPSWRIEAAVLGEAAAARAAVGPGAEGAGAVAHGGQSAGGGAA